MVEDETPRALLLKVLGVLQDDVRVEILNALREGDMISFRSLARRLRVNHKKLKRGISVLVKAGLVEEVQIRVSDGRVYRAYRLREYVGRILNSS